MHGLCRTCRTPFEFYRPTAGAFAPTLCSECIGKRRARLVTLTGIVTRLFARFVYIEADRRQYRWFADDGPALFCGQRVKFEVDPADRPSLTNSPVAKNLRPAPATGATT